MTFDNFIDFSNFSKNVKWGNSGLIPKNPKKISEQGGGF